MSASGPPAPATTTPSIHAAGGRSTDEILLELDDLFGDATAAAVAAVAAVAEG